MSSRKPATSRKEESAIDDVRRIRRRLQDESGGDMRKHIEQSNQAAKQYVAKLRLKPINAPSHKPRRAKTG